MKLFDNKNVQTYRASALYGSRSVVKFVNPKVAASQVAPVLAKNQWGDPEAEQTTCVTF